MKKEYQINRRQAEDEFCAWAKEHRQPVQLAFVAADVVALAQQSVGELLRQVGREFMQAVMETEVEQLVGTRSQPNGKRTAYRWGTEEGFCLIDTQRVRLTRPRVRSRQNRELVLGSYELFQRASLVTETVWQRIMHGLTMRNYKEVVQQFAEAYGLEKSTIDPWGCLKSNSLLRAVSVISEHFVEASSKKLEQLLTRSLADVQLCALLVDGTYFKEQALIAAVGIDRLGNKLVLGLVQGTTENATVVSGLFQQLAQRGLNLTRPLLYVIDGSKALRSAIVRHAGDAAFIQRCQLHKLRNVAEYLPEAERTAVKFRMRGAYAKPVAAEARAALYKLHDELMQLNPTAADSLAEGLDETLTLQELGIRGALRRAFSSTNIIESSFSLVERICRQVKRWQGRDQRLRWVASALLYAESRWNRQMAVLVNALEEAYHLRLRENNLSARTSVA